MRVSSLSAALAALTVVVLAVLVLAAGVLSACGGGGGDGGAQPSPVFSRLAASTASLDGWVQSDGPFSAAGTPHAGDIDLFRAGVTASAFYSFDVSALPAGAEIVSASVSLYLPSHFGVPYATYGSLWAHYHPYGDDLANATAPIVIADPPPPTTFTPANATPGTKTADMRALLQRALQDGFFRLQIQVAFDGPSNNDGLNDYVNLTDAEDGLATGEVPVLTYSWREP